METKEPITNQEIDQKDECKTAEQLGGTKQEDRSSQSIEKKEGSDAEQTAQKKVPWFSVIATSIFISLPAAIPFYFSTVVGVTSTKILFIVIGIFVVLFNVYASTLLFNNYFKGNKTAKDKN